MSTREVTMKETGKSCPYCRFPLKQGTQASPCPVCGVLHHTDCWEEGGGCAVVGCAGGPGADATTEINLPPAGKAVPVPVNVSPPVTPPEASAPPAPAGGVTSRNLVIAAMAGMGVVIVLLIGLVLFGGSDDSPEDSAATPAQSDTPIESDSGDGSSGGSTAPSEDEIAENRRIKNENAANTIAVLLVDSENGRNLSGEDPIGALANRKMIRRKLERLNGATGPVEGARRKFLEAMNASITANEVRASSGDAAAYPYDEDASRLKGELESIWNGQVAPQYGLNPIDGNQI